MYTALLAGCWGGILVLNFLDALPGFRDFSCLCVFSGLLGGLGFLVLTCWFEVIHGSLFWEWFRRFLCCVY